MHAKEDLIKEIKEQIELLKKEIMSKQVVLNDLIEQLISLDEEENK